MTEFQDIQRLIRLKRFETPGEDFVEDFVSQFRERQRSEVLRMSARGLLWERVSTYFENLVSPKWMTAATTAAVCLLGGWAGMTLLGSGVQNHSSQIAALSPASIPQLMPSKPSLTVVSPLLQQAEAAERQVPTDDLLLSKQIGLVGVSGENVLPSQQGLFPVSDFGR